MKQNRDLSVPLKEGPKLTWEQREENTRRDTLRRMQVRAYDGTLGQLKKIAKGDRSSDIDSEYIDRELMRQIAEDDISAFLPGWTSLLDSMGSRLKIDKVLELNSAWKENIGEDPERDHILDDERPIAFLAESEELRNKIIEIAKRLYIENAIHGPAHNYDVRNIQKLATGAFAEPNEDQIANLKMDPEILDAVVSEASSDVVNGAVSSLSYWSSEYPGLDSQKIKEVLGEGFVPDMNKFLEQELNREMPAFEGVASGFDVLDVDGVIYLRTLSEEYIKRLDEVLILSEAHNTPEGDTVSGLVEVTDYCEKVCRLDDLAKSEVLKSIAYKHVEDIWGSMLENGWSEPESDVLALSEISKLAKRFDLDLASWGEEQVRLLKAQEEGVGGTYLKHFSADGFLSSLK